MASITSEGFSLVAHRLYTIANILNNIRELSKISEKQKQRVYHIEEGMKYLHNAIREGGQSDFYSDALSEFKKSLLKPLSVNFL